MIEKFNFYDVYGYFLPGLALIAVLWLPFGLVAHIWPKGDWGSAIIAVALAYFVGHLMLYVSTNVVPSIDVKKSRPGKERNPSETVLDADADSKVLSSAARDKIAEAVRQEFKMELHIDNSTGDFDGDRKGAFFFARQRLILEKVEGYAEQFQGMYSLARGLVVAFAVGTVYYFGWILSRFEFRGVHLVVVGYNFLCLLALVNLVMRIMWAENREEKRKRERRFAVAFLLLFLGVGWMVGLQYRLDARECISLALAAAASLILSFRCYIQYRFFSVQFAVTVWRDFAAYVLRDLEKPKCRMLFE